MQLRHLADLSPFALLFPLGSAGIQEGSPAASPEILAAELEAHVRFLASDELEGRRVGSEGIEEAARYLAGVLEATGLEPAGDDGGFLQRMDFEIETFDAVPELVGLAAAGDVSPATYGADFRVVQGGEGGDLEVVVVRAEDELPGEEDDRASLALCLADMSRGKARRWLEERGAPSGAGFGLVIGAMRRPGQATTRPPRSSRPRLFEGAELERLTPWVEVEPELHELFAAGELPRLRFDLHHRHELAPTHNVLARLPGRGTGERPELAKEAVVISAHYDHLGLAPAHDEEGAEEPQDLVYNGADDDASGVACVLELAACFASEDPPARELLFLLATAEELGVVGTSFYLDHPATPLERTVANLNFEMLGRPDAKAGGPGKLWLSGPERTNLFDAWRSAGVEVEADPYPEQSFFLRSDNIVFCWRGIVGQTFSSYDLHQDYHQVSDEADTLDYDHLEAATRAAYEAVRLVADGSIDPEWLEGGRPDPPRR